MVSNCLCGCSAAAEVEGDVLGHGGGVGWTVGAGHGWSQFQSLLTLAAALLINLRFENFLQNSAGSAGFVQCLVRLVSGYGVYLKPCR